MKVFLKEKIGFILKALYIKSVFYDTLLGVLMEELINLEDKKWGEGKGFKLLGSACRCYNMKVFW